MASAPRLEVRRLGASYGQIVALRDVSFDLLAGEAVLIVGPNGAGKSTLIRSIMGCHTGSFAGSIVLDGSDVTHEKACRRAKRGIAWVAEGRGVVKELTVRDNLDLARFGHRWTPAARARSLERFPVLARALDRIAGTLSGGEQQMLAIARAIETAPRLLLIDEPSLGLAPVIVDEVMDHLSALKREGQTILLVEQRAAQVKDLADKIYLLQEAALHAAPAILNFAEMDFETFSGTRPAAAAAS